MLRHFSRSVLALSAGMLVVALASAIILTKQATAAPGDLDASFGSVITTCNGSHETANAVALQTDGKVVAVGVCSLTGDFGVVRLNPDGTFDSSFGVGGKAITNIGYGDYASAVALQPDGEIIVGGSTGPGGYCCQFALARFNTDGALDTSFGASGVVTTPFGGISTVQSVHVQADGKIVAVGSKYDPFENGFALARYNADGTLDATFGTGGRIMTSFDGSSDRAEDSVIQPDGKVVVAGNGGANEDFALARYLADGSLDSTFGVGGKVLTDFGSTERAYSIALQQDGKIVAGGQDCCRAILARYNPDGSLDVSFGTGGKVTTPFTGHDFAIANALAVQSNGKIVAAGIESVFDTNQRLFALTRYNPDGTFDATFGINGKAIGDSGLARDLAIQPGGNIVAVGGVGPCGGSPCSWMIARYEGDSAPPSPTPTPPPSCNADLDGDGAVTGRDVALVARNLRQQNLVADLNGDGKVSLLDLTIVIKRLHVGC